MKKVILFTLFFIVICCKQTYNIERVIDGSWSLYQVEHGIDNKSLLPNNESNDFVFGVPLYLNIQDGFMTLDIETDRKVNGRISAKLKGKEKFIEIFDSEDDRFNGEYQIWIDTVSSDKQRDKYRILLESDSIFMVGTKTIVKKIF